MFKNFFPPSKGVLLAREFSRLLHEAREQQAKEEREDRERTKRLQELIIERLSPCSV
ncbi:MAG: hypothetical protein K0U41_06435 [Gammaproteobacteria bacterium]|nr:hypothetical protein [Gammaproteobacteria bacterium]